MKILAALSAMLDLWAAESRAGIRLIEAQEASGFEARLRLVTRNEQERADLREIAVLAGQMGLRADDIEPMARAYYRGMTMSRITEEVATERDAALAVITEAHGLYTKLNGTGEEVAWAMWEVLEAALAKTTKGGHA